MLKFITKDYFKYFIYMYNSNFMNQLKTQKLSEYILQVIGEELVQTIVKLESDEIIQQMRNDPHLYEEKVNYIKDLVISELSIDGKIDLILEENEVLREEKTKLEEALVEKCQQFATELDKIQKSAQKHTKLKENEIYKLIQTLSQTKQQISSLEKTKEENDKKNSDLKLEIERLKTENCQSKKGLEKVKKVLQRYENDHEQTIQHLQVQFKKEVQEYEAVIQKMQSDMGVIKSQWQKKCADVENTLRNSYKEQLLNLEEKKSRELQHYLQTCKEGKPIIIKEDTELANSKIQLITQQYEAEITLLQRKCGELTVQNIQFENQLARQCKHQELTEEKHQAEQKNLEQDCRCMQEQNERIRKELESFKLKNSQSIKEVRQHNLQIQSKDAQLLKLKDKLKLVQKQLQISQRNTKEQRTEIRRFQKQKRQKQEQIEELKNNILSYVETIDELKDKISVITKKNKQFEVICKQKSTQLEKLESKEKNYYKQYIKDIKKWKIKIIDMVSSLLIQIKQEKREITLLKNDIKYIGENNKKIANTQLLTIIDEFDRFKQIIQKKNKQKIAEMIDDFECTNQKDHQQFESIQRQNEKLKRQIKRMQCILEEKDLQIQNARQSIITSEIQEVKRICLNQVNTERQKNKQLAEQYERKSRQHHIILQKTKNEVKDTIKLTLTRWSAQLSRLEDQIRRKDKQLILFNEKIQTIVTECEEAKKNQEQEREENKKMKKKYEILKLQKQEKIQDLLRRLQSEIKHKLALEKELKSIRNELNRTQIPVKQYQSFPSRSHENRNIGNTDRERQLSQIRELIAKTYKAVGEKPESQSKWKKMF